MPCVFLKNVPTSFTGHDKFNFCRTEDVLQTGQLYAKIAEAAGCQTDDVEIHISSENYKLLSTAGYIVACPNVHGFVVWLGKESRDIKVKQKIADALQHYLNQFEIGKGFDLTFMDMPAGSFFVEKDGQSIMVPGGEPTIPFSLLNYTVSEATGWTADGFDPDDAVLY